VDANQRESAAGVMFCFGGYRSFRGAVAGKTHPGSKRVRADAGVETMSFNETATLDPALSQKSIII